MTRKYPSAWDLNLELEDIDKDFSVKLLKLGPVREVDNIRRASRSSKKTIHRNIGAAVALNFRANFCLSAPVIPRASLPESGLVQTRMKHFGILSSTIYKERQLGKSLERARYIEANGVHEGLTQTDPTTIRIAKYVEGVDSPDNDRVVYCQSNVGETFGERIAFWSAFDREAVFRGDAKVEIDIRGEEVAWAR